MNQTHSSYINIDGREFCKLLQMIKTHSNSRSVKFHLEIKCYMKLRKLLLNLCKPGRFFILWNLKKNFENRSKSHISTSGIIKAAKKKGKSVINGLIWHEEQSTWC